MPRAMSRFSMSSSGPSWARLSSGSVSSSASEQNSAQRPIHTSACERFMTTCRSFMRGEPYGIHSMEGDSSESGGCGASQANSSREKMIRS
eukprot:scaffold8150_cov72-Phaeocystis_antarctica.AAC.8